MGKLICKHCGKTVPLNSARITEDGDVICSRCADDEYIQCCHCSNYISRSSNRVICKACDERVYSRVINNYSTKPIPRFKSRIYEGDKGVRFFGLELEFNCLSPAGAYALFNDLYKDHWIYNKSDASVSNGVEIVTNPMDRSNAKKLLNRMADGLEQISSDIRSYKDNAGIHIHVNRKSVDPIDVYKLGYLFNYKMPSEYKRLIYYISNRLSTSTDTTDDFHYCSLGTRKDKTTLGKPTGDRYNAINLQNTSTIEFRLFKTVADPEIIESYIEFTDKSLEYCHTHSLKQMNIPSFILWLYDNTDNKILKHKIDNFQRYNTKLSTTDNCYTCDVNSIKGININDYEKYLGWFKYCSDYQDIYNVIDRVKSGQTRPPLPSPETTKFGSNNKLSKMMETTLKKVLISKIMKGIKECA